MHIRTFTSGYTAVYGVDTLLPPAFSDVKGCHITLLTKAEGETLKSKGIPNPFDENTSLADVFSLGLGGSENGTQFVGILFNSANVIRRKVFLPFKDFHISLKTREGSSAEDFKHDHGELHIQPLVLPNPTSAFLDNLAFHYTTFSSLYDLSIQASLIAISLDEASAKPFVRLGDASFQIGASKLSMLAFGRAYDLSLPTSPVRKYCIKNISRYSRYTEWGQTISESEWDQVSELSTEIKTNLWTPWSGQLRDELVEYSEKLEEPDLVVEPREKIYVGLGEAEVVLQRYFRWIIPFRLAVSSEPVNSTHISLLASPLVGIRQIVTMTAERHLPPEWFSNLPISNVHIPVVDGKFPSFEMIEIFLRLVLASASPSSGPVLVHCAGGKGRAGSLIAAYLIAYGFKIPKEGVEWLYPPMSSGEAISLVRKLRPGSIETWEQEEGLKAWSKHITKRGSPLPIPIEEPLDPFPTILTTTPIASILKNVDLIILCGLPGSGKSWFWEALLKRDPKWTTTSGDEDGGSNSVYAATSSSAQGSKLLIDRCNPKVKDRTYLLSLAHHKTTKLVIHFSASAELCTSRAQNRLGHPSLPPGPRVVKAITHFESTLVPPTRKEGFDAVITIPSFAAAMSFIQDLAPVHLYKFPRTAHLVDLGGATADDEVLSSTSSLFRTTTSFQDHNSSTSSNPQLAVITEKLDGANLGISLSSSGELLTQNRSHFINSSTHMQFKKLGKWLEDHSEDLNTILRRDESFLERYILFGEWMAVVHSVAYNTLPSYFVAFDLYDRVTGKFSSRTRLERILAGTSIYPTPLLYSGPLPSQKDLIGMIEHTSNFGEGKMEGIYVKIEDEETVIGRGKIVRGDFIAGDQHWSKGMMSLNQLSID